MSSLSPFVSLSGSADIISEMSRLCLSVSRSVNSCHAKVQLQNVLPLKRVGEQDLQNGSKSGIYSHVCIKSKQVSGNSYYQSEIYVGAEWSLMIT